MRPVLMIYVQTKRQIYPLGPAYNDFGYNDHLGLTSRFHRIRITDYNVEKFCCTGYPLKVKSHLRFLGSNYCLNYSHNNGLYCTKWVDAFTPEIVQNIAIKMQK